MEIAALSAIMIRSSPEHGKETKYKNWWTVTLHKINYGTTNIKGSDTNYAILDTGTSLIAIAKTDYNNFVEELMTQVDTADCNSANGC